MHARRQTLKKIRTLPSLRITEKGGGGLSLTGGGLHDGFGGFDGFGGSGEHLALLLLVLQNAAQWGNRGGFDGFGGFSGQGNFSHNGYPALNSTRLVRDPNSLGLRRCFVMLLMASLSLLLSYHFLLFSLVLQCADPHLHTLPPRRGDTSFREHAEEKASFRETVNQEGALATCHHNDYMQLFGFRALIFWWAQLQLHFLIPSRIDSREM